MTLLLLLQSLLSNSTSMWELSTGLDEGAMWDQFFRVPFSPSHCVSLHHSWLPTLFWLSTSSTLTPGLELWGAFVFYPESLAASLDRPLQILPNKMELRRELDNNVDSNLGKIVNKIDSNSWAMTQAFNPHIWEAEAGGSQWVRGQPGLQREFQDRLPYRGTLSKTNKNTNN